MDIALALTFGAYGLLFGMAIGVGIGLVSLIEIHYGKQEEKHERKEEEAQS